MWKRIKTLFIQFCSLNLLASQIQGHRKAVKITCHPLVCCLLYSISHEYGRGRRKHCQKMYFTSAWFRCNSFIMSSSKVESFTWFSDREGGNFSFFCLSPKKNKIFSKICPVKWSRPDLKEMSCIFKMYVCYFGHYPKSQQKRRKEKMYYLPKTTWLLPTLLCFCQTRWTWNIDG